MKILITGGMGFIGLHLVDYLLKKGNKIIVLDNFSNSNKNLIKKIQNKNLRIIEGDIRKIDDIVNSMENQEVVIHLAAKISVNESIENPNETFDVNVNGTKNVLKACKQNNIKKLIVASSAAVYGEGDKKIKVKEEKKKNPISPYGESKMKMEEEIEKNNSSNEMDYIILRFFNIYGIGQTSEYAGVITKFLEKIKKNQSLTITGDGTQIRDFVSISDVICSINDAIGYNKSGIFNIASGNKITINELANLMIELSGKKLDIKNMADKQGEIKYSQANILLAKQKLGYVSKINLKEGIKKLLEK